MITNIMLIGAVAIAAPVLAQAIPASPQTVPAQPATPPAAANAVPAQPADATGTATSASAETPPAAGEPVAPTQIGQVVETEFPNYDKDGNGTLSRTEFAAWLVALKTQSDPTTKPDSAATRAYVASAFIQADKDKSKTVSKAELTGFLTPAKS